jgi:CRP-like cAMP-binding protein
MFQPELCDAVLGFLIKSNVQLQYDLASNLLHTVEERLARILSSLVESHKSGNNPVSRITQQELAHMIGITRQRVNALLRKFRQSGSIEGTVDLTLNRVSDLFLLGHRSAKNSRHP